MAGFPSPQVLENFFYQILKTTTTDPKIKLPEKINTRDRYARFIRWCTTTQRYKLYLTNYLETNMNESTHAMTDLFILIGEQLNYVNGQACQECSFEAKNIISDYESMYWCST